MGAACSICATTQVAETNDPQEKGGSGGAPDARRASYCSPEKGNVRKKSMARGPAWGTEAPFNDKVVGTLSFHGVKMDMSGRTSAKINQDRGCVCYPLGGHKDMALFAVYDGHGAVGEQVSEFIMVEVQKFVEAAPNLRDTPGEVLKDAFHAADQKLKQSKIDAQLSGTTAVVAILFKNKIWVANCGDSRCTAAVFKNGQLDAQDLSDDHKADLPAEMQRILDAKGYVTPCLPAYGPARVWLSPGYGPGLAMSRSIGDLVAESVGVIPIPDIVEQELTPDHKFLILASDGVWEFIESPEAVQIVGRYMNDAHQGCEVLMDESAKRWKEMEGNYRDDITAVVVHLPCLSDSGLLDVSEDDSASSQQAMDPLLADKLTDENSAAWDEKVRKEQESGTAVDKPNTFVKRKLSVVDMSAAAAEARGEVAGESESAEAELMPVKS